MAKTPSETAAKKAAGAGKKLRGDFSYRVDTATTGTNAKHIHVFKKKNEIFAINFDGTAHDDWHQTPIPKKVAKKLESLFDDITIPDNNFIKSVLCME